MADVQTTDINTKPTVTAIDSNDQIYISDGGTALKKISYTNLAKAIIEQYNASQLAGATKTIQAAFNELNSNKLNSTGTNHVFETHFGSNFAIIRVTDQNGYYINLTFHDSGKVEITRYANGEWKTSVVLREADS